MRNTAPRKVYAIRVDEADLVSIRKLKIQIGPHVRKLVKRLIRERMKEKATTWQIQTK